MSSPLFQIFSDGASFNNGLQKKELPRFASVGLVITLNERVIYRGCKGIDDATISVAEVTGVLMVQQKLRSKIESLGGRVKPPFAVDVYSDSEYVIKGINENMPKWVANGWRNYSGAVVAQLDLWKQMKREFIDDPNWDATYSHVRGHTDGEDFLSQMNQLCDDLAFWKLCQMKEEKDIALDSKARSRLREVNQKWTNFKSKC